MILKKWEDLPEEMRNDEVRHYYDILKKKRMSLALKRAFDIVVSVILLIALSPLFLILSIAIKIDSKGPVFYRQIRMTQYNRQFRIFKFRSMVQDADKGSLVTLNRDARITRIGKVIRACRLDEISQLIDVLRGTMTFVGTRPEVPKYTHHYTHEMMATLLLPAGITSLASIYYKDEAELLNGADNADEVYIGQILPEKMKYNLKWLEEFSFWKDIKIMLMTVLAMLGKNYTPEE
jgi:lipopolysaccharide/colanic/teichoic acid biosynthesis glycosyltransferase